MRPPTILIFLVATRALATRIKTSAVDVELFPVSRKKNGKYAESDTFVNDVDLPVNDWYSETIHVYGHYHKGSFIFHLRQGAKFSKMCQIFTLKMFSPAPA